MALENHQHDSGFALFNTVIITMVLAAISLSVVLVMQRGALRLSNQHTAAQTRLYLDSMENLLPRFFERLIDSEQPVALTQDWSSLQQYEIDRGEVWGQANDLQGRFNLAWLRGSDADAALAALTRLCVSLDLEEQVARSIANAVTGPGGGIGSFLSGLRGVEPEDWQRLQPYLAELPASATLNINTAPDVVLQALVPGLPNSFWRAFFTYRTQQPLVRVEELRFRTLAVLDKTQSDQILWSLMGTSSVYFEVRIAAQINGKVLGRYLVLMHDERTEILSRRPDLDPLSAQGADQ